MNKLKSFINYLRFAKNSKLLVAGAITLVAGGAFAFTTLNQPQHAGAQNCANDVICGGASSAGDFVNKYNANAAGDLHAIFQNYGLSQNEISRFASSAKMGTAYKDGRVEVDGEVVATNANSLGRTNLGGKNNNPVNISGKTYHWGANSLNFGSNSLPALVMMNPDTHEMEFAVLTACANPVWGNSPKYKCSMLNREQVNRTTFNFSTNVVAENGATVSKVVYDFGDGTSETRTNPSEKVTHNYTKAGNFTAKVTVYFNVNGKEKTDTRVECTKPVEVKEAPTVACTAVNARQISRNKYEFTASGSATGGATLNNGSFNFGDNQSVDNVQANALKVIAQHEYAKEGNYTIKATLNFDVEGKVTAKTCEVKINVSPEACPINPSVPKNSPECEPCPYDKNLPKNSPACKAPETPVTNTPPTLPSTGPAEMIGSALGLGSIVGAGGYYFRTRRELLNSIFKR